MSETTNFSEIPIHKLDDWEHENNAVMFFADEKPIAFKKSTDEEGDPALVILINDDSKFNSIRLLEPQLIRLKKYLNESFTDQ